MYRIVLFTLVVGFLALQGCSTVQLTEAGKKVAEIEGAVPAGCTKLKRIKITTTQGLAPADRVKSAKNDASNDAAESGATHIKVVPNESAKKSDSVFSAEELSV